MRPHPTGQRRLEYAARHTHAGDGPQLVLDFAKERHQLFLLVARNSRIDRDQIPAARIESEVLVLPIAQALAQHRRRAQQYERYRTSDSIRAAGIWSRSIREF